MSKAFTKEDDGTLPERLPDLPISQHPNHVTPRGLIQLQNRAAALAAEIARLRHRREFLPDLTPLAVAERDLRYTEARLASAIPVMPPETPDQTVRFGATVTVTDENGKTAIYRIVGEDESDPAKGLIAAHSPLARALIEAGSGDIVEWPKPAGMVELEIINVTYTA